MKSSRYNFWSQTPDGSPLLFNGRTGALVELEATEEQAVRTALQGQTTQQTKALFELGFLLSDAEAEDEVAALLRRRGSRGSTSPVLEVTISPTYGCNFRCTYCYVDFDDARMTDDAAERTLLFLEREVPRHPQTNITWFGGEPLLAWRRVVSMATAFAAIGEREHRPVLQFLTTNGYLLGGQVARELVGAGVKWFHVTIDGACEAQNTRRVLHRGHPTYDRVLENTVALLEDYPGVGVTLRMNLELDSVPSVEPLLTTIPKALRARVQVHPTPVIRSGCPTPPELHRAVASMVTDALSLGYAYFDNDIPVGRPFHCTAEGEDNFQISPDGRLHKCSPSGKPEVTVGTIDVRGNRLLNQHASRWAAAHETAARCLDCQYLCFCSGGCRLDRVRGTLDDACTQRFEAVDVHIRNRWLVATLQSRRGPGATDTG